MPACQMASEGCPRMSFIALVPACSRPVISSVGKLKSPGSSGLYFRIDSGTEGEGQKWSSICVSNSCDINLGFVVLTWESHPL